MTASEFADWDCYCELYGPLDLRARLDHAAARIAYTVASCNGSKLEYRQFLDHPAPPPIDESGMNDVDRQFLAALSQPGQNIIARKKH